MDSKEEEVREAPKSGVLAKSVLVEVVVGGD